MVSYTDINELTPKEFKKLQDEYDKENATVMTLILRPNGDTVVLSPLGRAWSRHFLLEAGYQMPGVQTN